MKFGVFLANWEPFAYYPKMYEKVAVIAEKLEYDSFFVTDHFMRPHITGGLSLKQHSTLEAWTMLAYLAAKTSTIKLGTCVTPLPMRHPPILAKIVTTLDVLSNGRVIFGVGAGYDENEFRCYGVNSWEKAKERVERVREGLLLMKKMWTEEVVSFEGKYYKVNGLVLEPKPIQKPYPPILTGAMGVKMLQITAEMGDYWAPSRALGATPQFYLKSVRTLRKECEKYNRKVKFGLMGFIVEKNSDVTVPHLGTFNEALNCIEEYRRLGCEYLLLTFLPAEKYEELMKKFKLEIAPSFE